MGVGVRVGVGEGGIAVRVAGAIGAESERGMGRLSVNAQANSKTLAISAQMVVRGLMLETITQARISVNASNWRLPTSGRCNSRFTGNALTVLSLHVRLLTLYCDGALH